MKILSMDQSTRITGWSIFSDGEYVTSGVIDLHKIRDTEERSRQMAIEICSLIRNNPSDCVVIEEVALTSNAQTLKLLARIQGVAIGFCAAHNIPLHILEPTRWRSCLGYSQDPKVKREQLKAQSLNFVKKELGLNIKSEDENEAVAIGVAANRIYGFDDEI